MADSTLISGLATAGATVIAGAFVVIGRKRGSEDEGAERTAVSLTKQLMNDQRRDLDRARKHIAKLEADVAARDATLEQLRGELDYAHARIATLGGP